ncbi:MAG: PspA/IM30 family protein [Chloroherpetonaceae bacterium]|nr:PspA/IM30 family protein [Chloroherpetonaceae bacterium]MDW8438760.1 PspA/IM30 family protein [Chloroherpetonaceae bacterium]
MAGIFKRLFRWGQSEIHAGIDKLEDPVKMTEQGIRELKQNFAVSMQSLAQVKASAIRLKKDGEDQLRIAQDYERKAMLLLQRAAKGDIDPAEADRLATEALNKKAEYEARGRDLLAQHATQQQLADNLQVKVDKLRQNITKYENELITLKARARTAESMRKINEQLSGIDSDGTVAMLEKMKEKVNQEEALAEAYGKIAENATSIDEQIEKALKAPSVSGAPSDSLLELKRKMGLLPAEEPKPQS